MPKTKNFIIPYQIYPFDLMVSLGESDEQLFKRLRKRLPKDIHDEIKLVQLKPSSKGKCVMFSCGATCIRTREHPKTPKDFGTLQHEIFHASHFLFDRIGINLTDDSCEAWSYLIEYITKEIYSRI